MAKEKDKEPSSELQGYLDTVAVYDREFAKWERRVERILKRYRDEKRDTSTSSRFNILWSNVQVLVPATFARIPQPDVSRRFRDQDPVGRVAALILERAEEYEITHYADYAATMRQSVLDRFLGGRGTAWVRYEPHFKPGEVQEQVTKPDEPPDGVQVTEDVENEVIEEQLDYECAPVDYVHWKDFGHSIARTWEEVTCVWRKVYMSEDAVEERFGEEIAKKIPYDASPEDSRKTAERKEMPKQALVYELWDKNDGVAVWFSKSLKDILDKRDDPLKLQDFFPCPKPLFATLTNDTLVPVPDFTLYQDQAKELDVLADRKDGLIRMLQVKGVYDGSADSSIARLFTEGENGTLLPVKNWAAFAEKNGLKGQIDVYDLSPLVKALEACYVATENIKGDIYEIMGISDIVRGSSDPNETLGAQELKGQYASMRLNQMKADVARYATDILRIKAQIMCSKFNPKTLASIAAVEQLNEADRQYVEPALALLVGEARMTDPEADSPNPLRSFRIEVNADSMVQMNEQEEKTSRMEFLTANGAFMEKATQMVAQAGAAAPIITPLIMEMWKFGVTGFKVGKSIEGAFDEAADKLKQLAAQPPAPKPDPEMAKVEAQKAKDAAMLQADAERSQQEGAMEVQRIQAESLARERELRMEGQLEAQRNQMEDQRAQNQAMMDAAFARFEALLKAKTAVEVAEIGADASIEASKIAERNKPKEGAE